MSKIYETIHALCEKNLVSGYRLCKDTGIRPSILTDLKMGRQNGLSANNAQKIADYFGVTVGHLLGEEDTKNAPAEDGKRTVTDEDIKFALFGGDGEITDEMYKEVLNFAAFVKNRESNK